MVKVLDNYYFKELDKEELDKQLARAVTVREDIKTMDQVS